MKKILSIVLLCACLAITCSAMGTDNYQIEYEDLGVTIIFDQATVWTSEERQAISDNLVYGVSDDGASTYAWCWLTGHDIITDSVTAIQHKVSSTIPRCLRTVYKVETCSKCDYFKETALSSVYIDCCPEE